MISAATDEHAHAFRHEALFYADDTEYVAGTAPFISEGLADGEAVLVAVGADKTRLLADALGPASASVRFADMAELGRNPGRIISAWARFVDEHTASGRKVRGIGEPIWRARTDAELTECQRHESLLNLAFADSVAWSLLCPYDTASLEPEVIAEAKRSHPFLVEGGRVEVSAGYRAPTDAPGPFEGALPVPGGPVDELAVALSDLEATRRFVASRAVAAGIDADRTADLVLAVSEVATNTLRYAGGGGRLRVWREKGSLLCEVIDRGRILDPLTGRIPPRADQPSGRGLWMANQLCDLVQIRSSETENVVRLHMSAG